MDAFRHLLNGLAIAATPQNLLWCFIGCFWGSIVGVLPGLGPMAGMTLLLPLTFHLDPTGAVIMLSGIFYGAMYGGSTTSILMRIPGEAASVVTCIDGYEMTKKGRAGAALTIAAVGSFVGGVFSVIGLMLVASWLANAMLAIGPAAEFVMLAATLLIAGAVASSTLPKTLAMIVLGLLLAMVGNDPLTATPRFTFGSLQLADGLSFTALAIGLFGISEMLMSLEAGASEPPRAPKLTEMLPTREEMRESVGPIARGSLIGFLFGVVPGVGHIVSTSASYSLEKAMSKTPEKFGKRRGGGRRRAGDRQQRDDGGGDDPAADPRHSRDSGDGGAARRADRAQRAAGSDAGLRAAGRVLGADRQHADRQRDPGDPEPAAGRDVRDAAAHAACPIWRRWCCWCASSASTR